MNTYTYRIDRQDTIISVSKNWGSFADANEWTGPIRPNDVVGHSLWKFIQDLETRHVYQEIFQRVRAGVRSRPIPFRCDSPGERRHLELLTAPLPNKQIQITSRILRTEHRPPVTLLSKGVSRLPDFVTLCSMCKKMKVSPAQWFEIEEGLAYLKLFNAKKMPQLSHGVCNPCYRIAMANMDKVQESPNPPRTTA